MSKFQTGAQVVVSSSSTNSDNKGKMPRDGSNDGYRLQRMFKEMLEDPTIRLAVDVITAMLKKIPWTVEGVDTEYCTRIWQQIENHREQIIQSALRGYLRNGWRAFEVVYKLVGSEYEIAGLKPLKADLTEPLAYEDTGEFAGVENRSVDGREIVEIDEQHVLFINFDNECCGELGDPLLRVALGPHMKWTKCDEGAQRYDAKVAGGFLFIKYPVGVTPFADNGGADTDNSLIMAAVAKQFEAAGFGGVPVKVDPDTGEVIDVGWSVEHIAAGGGLQPNFVAREKYLDALKLRAFGIPERSATEGTFGTKAESEAHADIAVLINTDRLGYIVSCIHNQIVRRMNIANRGDANAARLIMGKLDPADRELFSAIFTSLMTDPVFGEQIASQVDVPLLLDKLNVPTKIQDGGLTSDLDPLLEVEDTPGVDQITSTSGRTDDAPTVPRVSA